MKSSETPFFRFQKQMRDNYHELDASLIFSNTNVTKESYCTRRLNYPLKEFQF